MDEEWITSPTGRRVLAHWADPRPAWLWSADGVTLLWRNVAAPLFHARLGRHGLKLAASPVPIKGQVARVVRLGATGRSSLSRIQFLAGARPVSTTCTVTPLALADGSVAVLVVAVDPVSAELLAVAPAPDAHTTAILPAGREWRLLADGEAADADGTALAAGGGATLLLAANMPDEIGTVRADEGAGDEPEPNVDAPAVEEPLLPMGLPPLPPVAPPDPAAQEADPTPEVESLTSLFDRLADHDELYGALTDADERFVPPAEAAPEDVSPAAPDMIGTIIDYTDDPEDSDQAAVLYRVVGRGFRPLARTASLAAEAEAADSMPAEPFDTVAPDPAADRATRYNFEELSRILADRVGGEPAAPVDEARPAANEGELVNLAAETLILNRLPIGILVFRDQQVLFANRALMDLTGHGGLERLRAAGLASVFSAEPSAGPVTQLLRADGGQVAVNARLQSIIWHGRPALMLSASLAAPRAGHEIAVRGFAELVASVHDDGFIATDRAGIVTAASARAAALLGPGDDLIGQPISALLPQAELPALRAFLERPARFAETERPVLRVPAITPLTELILLAEGQAGIVSGYFGFVRPTRPAVAGDVTWDADEIEPPMLARVSRGLRRPLNTIIGFAELIRSAAFGANDTERYRDYARDIHAAGQEIAVLVEELDDFTRLNAGSYGTLPAEVDLATLLETCAVRVRGQAAAARVLVRTAISERLPRIQADSASLAQAVLNLLASAIDQSPAGASVVLSAQMDSEGGIAIHIRDSAATGTDPAERFVVFREGVGKDGEVLGPVRSSVGLALTRSLLAVNSFALSVDPKGGVGTLFTLTVPAELIAPVAAQ